MSFLAGASLLVEAARLLGRERTLWPIALFPLVLSIGAVVGAVLVIFWNAGALAGFVTGWMPDLVATHWFSWLWVGPMQAGFVLVGLVLFVALSAAIVFGAFLAASLVGAPVHDLLSRRVERFLTGGVVESGRGVISESVRAVTAEAKRLVLFFALQGGVLGVGLLVPPLAILVVPLAAAIAIVFLPLEFTSFALDRRGLSFAERRQWVFRNSGTTLGYGTAAFAFLVIPGINFVAMPVFVTSGTMLALRCPR